MIKQSLDNELLSKKFLSILVVSGILISAVTFVTLTDNFRDSESKFSKENFRTLCDNGLCFTEPMDTIPKETFVQQNEKPNSGMVVQKNEEFPALNQINTIASDYTLTDNTAILYAAKDSFLREGIKESNEGSNEILRVMGTGPTNNRALIAFDQSQIVAAIDAKSLEAATLRIFIVSNDGRWTDSQTLNIHTLTADWKEGNGINAPFGNFIGTQEGVNWNCASDGTDCTNWNGGSYDQTPTDSILITNEVSGQWVEFDVTSDIKAFIGDSENNGWIIIKSDEESPGRINFAAREAQSNIPQLELQFS